MHEAFNYFYNLLLQCDIIVKLQGFYCLLVVFFVCLLAVKWICAKAYNVLHPPFHTVLRITDNLTLGI